MLQRLGIRGKILAVVAVPILVLTLAAGFVTFGATQDLENSQRVEGLLEVLDAGREVTQDLQDERYLGANYISAFSTYTTGFDRAVEQAAGHVATVAQAAAEESPGSEEDSGSAQSVNAQLAAIIAGGDSRRSLNELRAVQPEDGEDGWSIWPSDGDVDALESEYLELNAELVELSADAGDLQGVIDELRFAVEIEREQKILLFTETPELESELRDVSARSLVSAATFIRRVNGIEATADNVRVIDRATSITNRLTELSDTQERVQFRTISASLASFWYTDVLDLLTTLPDDVSAVVTDPELKTTIQAFAVMDVLVERLRAEQTLAQRLIRSGVFLPGESEAQRRSVAETDIALANAQRVVTPILPEGQAVPPFDSTPSAPGDPAPFASVRAALSTGLDLNLVGQRGANWEARVETELEPLLAIREDLWSNAEDTAGATAAATLFQTVITIAAVVLVVVASLFIALLIARRIVGPLRRLTTTATAVRQELPRLVERVALPGEAVDVSEVQIPVESSDEVGRLAEAFNSVNAATLAIAGEQAALRGSISEMFVNVARRDQVLLNRQLASIDEMERTEQDTTTLTKLFALDHLATRMRRNSESLLVLAGIDTGRRLRRPMPLSDVIRTASSEIELYERVQLELDADPAMVGHSALTAAHLFAELLENATVFSDPGSPVIVRTSQRGDNYIVEVIDDGIGMTPEELQEANARVASTAASEILGAQRLGLFVVGRIARRVGAKVEIHSVEGDGTTAVVTMPPSVFDASFEVDQSHTGDSTADAETGAPAALLAHRGDDEMIDAPPLRAPREEDSGNRAPIEAPIEIDSYQPTAIEGGASLSADDNSVEDLIAADAASAPVGEPANPAALTEGMSANGLPTRRRKTPESSASGASADSQNIMGLPARATDDQLSALASDSASGFTPTVSANEVSPQSVEERASMFRGFRSRSDTTEPVVKVEPDAESLGQAARRGAVAPEGHEEQPAVEEPTRESDANDSPSPTPTRRSAFAVQPADERHDSEPVTGQSPLVSTGYEYDQEPLDTQAAFSIPALEEDEPGSFEPDAVDNQAAQLEPELPIRSDQPDLEDTHAGVQSVSLDEDLPPVPAGEHAGDFSAPETHAQSVEPESAQPSPPQSSQPSDASPPFPGFRSQPIAPSPSIDDLISGGHVDDDDKSGFFGKLFGKSKPESPAEPTPTFLAPSEPAEPVEQPQASPPVQPEAFQPDHTSDVDEEDFSSPQPWSPTSAPFESSGITPAESATPYNPGNPGTPAPAYSVDQLASPLGWETAGASALEAARPDVQTSYVPVVDIQPSPMPDDESPDIASQVFSEFSSLSSERPKVEKTSAGLAKRRVADAPPVEVKPIEETTQSRPANRDPEEMRKRFSSFYSGTRRAREASRDYDQQTQPVNAKD